MFSSLDNNDYNLFDPFNFDQIQNPSSDHHHQYSPFTPYFEAFIGNGNDDDSLMMSQLLFQQQDIFGSCSNTVASHPRNDAKNVTMDEGKKKKKKKKMGNVDGGREEGGATAKEAVPRRSGKKDRHSKIYTAKGPRDRRMRLSLQIARKFFDLQDMLGFDKASKTIEWLISESKASIKELEESLAASSGGDEEHGRIEHEMDETQKGTNRIRRRRKAIKIVHELRTTKESRYEARKRARERTMIKRMNPRSGSVVGTMPGTFCDSQETNSSDLDKLGSSGTSQETREDLGSCSQETRPNVEQEEQEQEQEQGLSNVHLLESQIDSVRIIEKFLGITNDPSSSSTFGDSRGVNSEESYTDLPGNWSIGVSDGSQSSTGDKNVQFQNPREVFAFVAQDPNVSVIPMGTRSSKLTKKHNTASSASTNHPGERNHNSSLSIFDYLGY